MLAPKDISQLCSLNGGVTYYHSMWPRRSYILAPLTELTGKSKYEWTESCQTAFETTKSVMASDTLKVYPNHNLPFHIYTDSSDYQMGAMIVQQGQPVAY